MGGDGDDAIDPDLCPDLLIGLPPELIWHICRNLEGVDVLSLRAAHPYLRDAYRDNDMMWMRALAYYGRSTVRRYGWDTVLKLRRLTGRDDVRWLLGDRVRLRPETGLGPSVWSLTHKVRLAGGCVHLVLSDCKLEFVPDAVYTMEHLRSIDLSRNRLARLVLRFKRPMDSVVAEENRIATVDISCTPPQIIRELRLSGNRLTDVPWHAVRRISGLESLDLSWNPLILYARWTFRAPDELRSRSATILRKSLSVLGMSGVHRTVVDQTLAVLSESGWTESDMRRLRVDRGS